MGQMPTMGRICRNHMELRYDLKGTKEGGFETCGVG